MADFDCDCGDCGFRGSQMCEHRKIIDKCNALRQLVKELADDLSGYLCESECNGACASFGHCCSQTSRQIIAKAREVLNGGQE